MAILWRRRWVVLITTAVTALVAGIGALLIAPTYRAEALLRVLPVGANLSQPPGWNEMQYADRLMNTYVNILRSDATLAELAAKLGRADAPKVEVGIPANTELVQIVVEDPDPSMAAAAANTLADMFVAQVQGASGSEAAQQIVSDRLDQAEADLNQARQAYQALSAEEAASAAGTIARGAVEAREQAFERLREQYDQSQLAAAASAGSVSILRPAVAPAAPVGPAPAPIAALGLLAGLVGGLALAFLFENLDTRLHSTREIEQAAAAAVLGKIPAAKGSRRAQLYNSASPQEESFRRLRTNLFSAGRELPLRTLLVASAEPDEGKSTVVANLAIAVAKNGWTVVAVDCDMRVPSLHTFFGLQNDVGLSSVLRHEVCLSDSVQRGNGYGVDVLTSGPRPDNPVELLGSAVMESVIKELSQRYDIVLFDTPSLLAVADAAVLAPNVDGVMLVVGRTQARRESIQATYEQLIQVRANPVGIVVNRAEPDRTYADYRARIGRRR